MLKIAGITLAAVLVAESLGMFYLELMDGRPSFLLRVFIQSILLMACFLPIGYFRIFKGKQGQFRLSRVADKPHRALGDQQPQVVDERVERLQRANEGLLVEVQERATAAMALRTALNETRQGKEQLQAVINAACVALVVVDEQQQVLMVNYAAETMFGKNAYDMQGCSLVELLQPWAENPLDIELIFSDKRQHDTRTLISPWTDQKKSPIRMRVGKDIDWEGQSAKVLVFHDL